MIKQLLNSVVAKLCQCLADQLFTSALIRLGQIIDLLATDKSRDFAQPRPIIVNYSTSTKTNFIQQQYFAQLQPKLFSFQKNNYSTSTQNNFIQQ